MGLAVKDYSKKILWNLSTTSDIAYIQGVSVIKGLGSVHLKRLKTREGLLICLNVTIIVIKTIECKVWNKGSEEVRIDLG